MMNTGNVVLCLWHAASRSHFTHIFTFTSLHALLWMLSFHNPQVCVGSGRAGTWETDPKAPVLEESLCLGFLHLMRTGVKLRVMERYCARGYWNNLHMEMLFQPIDFWEAGSISTLDNNKAKYSSRKHCRQSRWRKKVHCELSGLFF